MTTATHANAFGLALEAEWPLPGFSPGRSSAPDVRLELTTDDQIDGAWSGAEGPPLWHVTLDAPLELAVGRAGDHLFTYGGSERAYLDPHRRRILCTRAATSDRSWQRALLDSVLLCTSLLCGHHPLHGAGVVIGESAIALVAAMGGGKTSLAWELMGRGAGLLSDDLLVLTCDRERVIAHPGPPLMNLPADRDPEPIGSTVARFPDDREQWIELDTPACPATPLAAVVLLERRPGSEDACRRVEQSPLPLLPHVPFLDAGAQATRARFEIMSTVAALVPMYRLLADSRRSPSQLADLVHDQLVRDRLVGTRR